MSCHIKSKFHTNVKQCPASDVVCVVVHHLGLPCLVDLEIGTSFSLHGEEKSVSPFYWFSVM